MKNILVLFSGGADSLLMLNWAVQLGRVVCLSYNYGQKHEDELKYARKLVDKVEKMHEPSEAIGMDCIDLHTTFQRMKSNLLKAGGETNYPGVHPMHVPARNAIFLSVAMGYAETYGFDEIWIGCDFSDRIHFFPDCYQEWIVKMNEVAKCNGSRPLAIKAPLLGWHKEDVLALLEKEGYNLKEVFSGYEPPKA